MLRLRFFIMLTIGLFLQAEMWERKDDGFNGWTFVAFIMGMLAWSILRQAIQEIRGTSEDQPE